MTNRLSPTVRPIEATFGAVVTDVDLTSLDTRTWRVIEEAFNHYGLLVFPEQHLSKEAQIAFGERFGAIEEVVAGYKAAPVTNQDREGELMADDEFVMKLLKGNEGWHTDSSYMPISARASILSAHVVPTRGGQTEWSDMRAAYDALSGEMRHRIEGLSAFHSIRYAQAQIGHEVPVGASYGMTDETPPLRPLVKVHPVTGRRSLFIGRHAFGIAGLDEAQSRTLLDELTHFACRPPRTYAHAWRCGDVAVWDNRCLLHRARPYDHRELRVMWHVRIKGDPVTELATNKPSPVDVPA